MNGIKILQRKKVDDIHLINGDCIVMTDRTGSHGHEKELLREYITKAIVIDEVVVFETDASVFGRHALAGAFIEK